MAKSLEIVRSVGKFFGITRSQSDDWKSKAERQIKEGEFGLSLKRSVSKHDKDQEKFVDSAKKMLSRISAFQTLDESQEQSDQNAVTSDRQSSTQSNTTDEPVAGSSQHTQSLTLTSPKHTQSLQKQWVYNKTYTESDTEETDVDSGNEISKGSKTKVRFELERENKISENSIRNMGHRSKSNNTETEKQTDRFVISDPYVSYKPENEKVPVKVRKTHQKSKIIFFDEIIGKHLHKTVFSDSDVVRKDRRKLLTEEQEIVKEIGREDCEKVDEYTMPKQRQDKSRSSPEVSINQKEEVESVTAVSRKEEQSRKGAIVNEDLCITDNAKKEAKPKKEKLQPEDIVYGKDALKHYKFYLQIEKSVENNRLRAELEGRLQEYHWKLSAIDEMILLAKDYYVSPKTKNASKWTELKRQVRKSSSHKLAHTDIRRKLATLPVYRPYFTYFIILAQLVSFIVISAQHGFTFIGLEPKLTVESDVQTFMGMETVHKWTAPNIWIGPSQRDLIGVGAVFAPCMRQDIQLQLKQSRQNYSTDTPLGCCEVTSRNIAGTTTEIECAKLTAGVGSWRGNVTCDKRSVTDAGVRHNMKPCCFEVRGECRLLSHKHCIFLGGTYYQFGPEHCSQVMCLQNVCKPGSLVATRTVPWQPNMPSQWWRVPLSLLYHHGIIELVFVIAAQWILISQIEWVAGWLRVFLIYILSGTMSLLTSAIFLPYESNVGAVGAVCGMGGIILVELVHFWRLVQRPYIELLKLLCATVLLMFLGTLPYLDTFGMLTGFIVGALSGIIFLPYITFGNWQMKARVTLVLVASVVLFTILYFLLQLFVTVQSIESCESCKIMNCVPYTEKMCDTALWQQF